MDTDDSVDPGDAALHELLVTMAGCTDDAERRDTLLDYSITTPPLADWPRSSLDALQETCRYVISIARLSRELERLDVEAGE